MRRTVFGLLCLLLSGLPVMADVWLDETLLLDSQAALYVPHALAIRCDDTFGLSGQAMKRLSPEQIESNPTIWRTEMQKRPVELASYSCLS